MEKTNKKEIGFFRKLYLTITDFRMYPVIVRDKFSKALSYFTKLILIVTVILAVYVANVGSKFIQEIIQNYDEIIPEFTLMNGKLDIQEEPMYNRSGEMVVVIDTTKTIDEFLVGENKEDIISNTAYIVINQDGISYKLTGVEEKILFQNSEEILTKATLKEKINFIHTDFAVKVMLFFGIWFGILLVYIVIKAGNILLITLFAMILNVIFMAKLKLTDFLKMILHLLTLPILIEMLSIVMLGSIPDYIYIAYQILTYIYVFYAIRAVKLDAMLTGVTEDNMQERIKQIIQEASEKIEDTVKQEGKTKEEEEPRKEEPEKKEEENLPEEEPKKEDENEEDKGKH